MGPQLVFRPCTPQTDLHVHLAASVLRQQPVFSTWRPVVVRAVAAELVQGILTPGDVIFDKVSGPGWECCRQAGRRVQAM